MRLPARLRRRARLLGLGLVLAVSSAVAACTPASPPDPATAPSPDGPSPVSEIPRFHLRGPAWTVVRTGPGHPSRRLRQANRRAAVAAKRVLTDLYVAAFLDPSNWRTASYDDAFGGFAPTARRQAESREKLLTAGPRAGDRYEEIRPTRGTIRTRILVDRRGAPTLVVSVVRFGAVASGDETVRIRSHGQFFFERVRGRWQIISFHVTRTDAPPEAA
ncbi:MAG TPA: hypothetical protein VFZ75_08310 [Actinomycetota bacterium]|nr:hypothetical protein [Actinomycetota bacterium]